MRIFVEGMELMDCPKTYRVANVKVEQAADKYWLEVYLTLIDNSEHRQLQVGSFVVETPDRRNRYSITGPTGDTSIIKSVGGSEEYKYTRFSMPIEKEVFDILLNEAIVRFAVEDRSEQVPVRPKEEIRMVNGIAQGIGNYIGIKEGR